MKVIAVVVLLALCCAALAESEAVPVVAASAFGHRLYWPWSFATDFYPYSFISGPLPYLTEDQLCYGVGVLSGCSGCEHGTQNLCRWVSLGYPGQVGQRFFTCLEKDFAAALILAKADEAERQALDAKGIQNVEYESQICNIVATRSASIQGTFHSPYDKDGKVVWEHTSIIFHSYHEMKLANVAKRPWAVDATSAWGQAGAMRLWGIAKATLSSVNRHPSLADVDCATLNDIESLSRIVPATAAVIGTVTLAAVPKETVINQLFFGVVANPRSRWCANLIMGSYLSTRCPEYGVAFSGLELSTYLHFINNCAASRGNTVSSLLIGQNPWSAIPFYIVPDGTPYAIRDIPTLPNEIWEDWLELDEIDIIQEGPPHVFATVWPTK